MHSRKRDFPIIDTANLLMREFRLDDAYDLFAYDSNEDATRYTDRHPAKSVDDSRRYVEKLMNSFREEKGIAWCIEHKRDRIGVGGIGVFDWPKDQFRAEVGFTIAKEYWGRGYAAEALNAVISYLFEMTDLVRLGGRCKSPNIASARVMEKAGMVYEGTLREYSVKNGVHYDVKFYSILRHEYLAIKNLLCSK